MNRPYRLILSFLVFTVLTVLALQAYWISNFYRQHENQFRSRIYPAMAEIAESLRERENLQITRIIVDGDDSVFVNEKHVNGLSTPRQSKKGNTGSGRSRIKLSGMNDPGLVKVFVNRHDSSWSSEDIEVYRNADSIIEIERKQFISRAAGRIDELKTLADKMQIEIMTANVFERNVDTLRKLIGKVLKKSGMQTPFEFMIRERGRDSAIVISDGFVNGGTVFESDLSAGKVFSTNRFLLLQFPNLTRYLLKGIKYILILAAVFSLFIIGMFYYTTRLIFRQKKLSEIKNDFVNNMTHELKTPIATISLAVDALNNPLIKNDDNKFMDYQRILREENNKLSGHVERVLQMALIDKGQLQLKMEPVELLYVIDGLIWGYHLRLMEQGGRAGYITSHDSMKMLGDKEALSGVFNNLMDNALKYSGRDCSISVNFMKRDGEIIVKFRDNGSGIPAHLHDKVFEKFFRVQGGNLHDVKGFGLGLSYVKSIVEAHGGTVELESEPGKGSLFTIRFKAYEEDTAG